jgi:cellobiose phosphorylase
MYRIWIEEVLGFQLRGDTLTLKPVLPVEWPGFEMTYRHQSATYEIAVKANAAGDSEGVELELDGRKLDDGRIPLADDGATHHVIVRMPKRPAAPPGEHATNGASSAQLRPAQIPPAADRGLLTAPRR